MDYSEIPTDGWRKSASISAISSIVNGAVIIIVIITRGNVDGVIDFKTRHKLTGYVPGGRIPHGKPWTVDRVPTGLSVFQLSLARVHVRASFSPRHFAHIIDSRIPC
uniref:Uncharacterized protein n=1 Tax=Anopheles culicifacies TaxID=139723 RepID=A0A182MSC1_9DIPT